MGESANPKKKTSTPGRTTPAKAKEPLVPTAASEWKKQNKAEVEVQVPSGNVALVRRVKLETFIASGKIPNNLLPLIQKSMASGGNAEETFAEQEVTPEIIVEMMEMVDAVTVETVVQPPVAPIPAEGEERNDDVLYVDEVDLADKMFLFQFAIGGSADLERFREEQKAPLEHLRAGAGVGDKTE